MVIRRDIKKYPILILGTYGFEYPKQEGLLVLDDNNDKELLINQLIEFINSEKYNYIVLPQLAKNVDLFSTIDFKHYIIIPDDTTEKEKSSNVVKIEENESEIKSVETEIVEKDTIIIDDKSKIDFDGSLLFTIPNCRVIKTFRAHSSEDIYEFIVNNCKTPIRIPITIPDKNILFKSKTNIIED